MVSQEFVVTARGLYDFELVFQEPHDLEAFRGLFYFTGDGSSVWVNRETADSDDPEIIKGNTPEAYARQQQGIRSGEYVARMAHSGVMIPVHLRIEALNRGISTAVVYDKVINTWNIRGNAPEGICRSIASVTLRSGTYRITASTTQTTTLPSNLGKTLLRVGWRPNTSIFEGQ
jgi:hypothetical protein